MEALKITAIILIVVTFLGLGLNVFTNKEKNKFQAKNYFKSHKVIKLCQAAKKGDIKAIDKLIQKGVDVNTVGKNGVTPLLWLFLMNKEKTEELKKGFKYLLEKGADPTKFYNAESGAQYTVLHSVARYPDVYYLKTVLDSGMITKDNIDIELDNDSNPTALLQAAMSDQFENFKLILDFGADIKWKDKLGRTLIMNIVDWDFIYLLLQRGIDYSVNSNPKYSKDEPDIVSSIERLRYWPSVGLGAGYGDYRQRCVEFLREKGVEINPWMPKNEKYIYENGKAQLYVNEGINWHGEITEETKDKKNAWVKYEDSSIYKKPKTEEEKKKAKDEEESAYQLQKAIVDVIE